jgi:hypothetical protein
MRTLQTNGAIVTAPSDLQPLKRVAQSLRIDWRRSPSLRDLIYEGLAEPAFSDSGGVLVSVSIGLFISPNPSRKEN